MLYRFVQIQETVNFLPVVQMVGNGTESVILRDGRKIVLPESCLSVLLFHITRLFSYPPLAQGWFTTLYSVVPTRMYSSSFIGSD